MRIFFVTVQHLLGVGYSRSHRKLLKIKKYPFSELTEPVSTNNTEFQNPKQSSSGNSDTDQSQLVEVIQVSDKEFKELLASEDFPNMRVSVLLFPFICKEVSTMSYSCVGF